MAANVLMPSGIFCSCIIGDLGSRIGYATDYLWFAGSIIFHHITGGGRVASSIDFSRNNFLVSFDDTPCILSQGYLVNDDHSGLRCCDLLTSLMRCLLLYMVGLGLLL